MSPEQTFSDVVIMAVPRSVYVRLEKEAHARGTLPGPLISKALDFYFSQDK